MQMPVLGINYGRIGFLATLGPEAIPEKLETVLKGKYEFLDLSLIHLEHGGERQLAVNDIVMQKPDGASVVNLGYSVNGVEMDSFQCDGLVVSTPAGSTAYNLSNGGPLASLGLNLMILTAIAPHTLRHRALLVGSGENLSIENLSLGVPVSLLVDGRNIGSVSPGESLSLSLADTKAHLVRTPEADFFRSISNKFIKP